MAGAFVAVADDATAFHWNPAGTVKGGPISVTVGWDDLQFGDSKAPPFRVPPAARTSSLRFSASPLGVSYGYMKLAQVVAVREDGTSRGRVPDHPPSGRHDFVAFVQRLAWEELANTCAGQAAIGETFAFTADEVLNQGLDFGGPKDGAFDVDAGVMADSDPSKAERHLRICYSPLLSVMQELQSSSNDATDWA
jgi:hypothetical protein